MCLRLDEVVLWQVLDGFKFGFHPNSDRYRSIASVSSSQALLFFLERRFNHNVGLECLVIHSCCVTPGRYEADLRDLVKGVTWNYVSEVGSEPPETYVKAGAFQRPLPLMPSFR